MKEKNIKEKTTKNVKEKAVKNIKEKTVKNKKKFIVVIICIAVIIAALITIKVIDSARKKAYAASAQEILNLASDYAVHNAIHDETYNLLYKITEGSTVKKPKYGEIHITKKGKISLALLYDKTCYVKDADSSDLYELDDINHCKTIYIDKTVNGAVPELDEGMIPVVYEDGIVKKASLREEWYNYTDKKWANAVLVSDASRKAYKEAASGTIIQMKDIMAFYVWVPRYKYKIFTDLSKITDNGTLSSQIDYIDYVSLISIEFENKDTAKSTGSKKGQWLTHPAFTFGDEELNGIWVGKFETSGNSYAPTVLPTDTRYAETTNLTPSHEKTVAAQFVASREINYGITSKDPAMLKNSEWGAIAYLATSIYGQGTTEIMINNSYDPGCAASVAPTKGYESYVPKYKCENEWYTVQGGRASTTGNIYGIYDMNGGTWEYVMAVMEDSKGSGVPASGRSNVWNSGFTGKVTCPTCYEVENTSIKSVTGLDFPESKYYDLYAYGTSNKDYSRGHLGDATVELNNFANWLDADDVKRQHSGFHKDYAIFVSSGNPWLTRGGGYSHGSSAGIFAFDDNDGANDSFSFRSVLR